MFLFVLLIKICSIVCFFRVSIKESSVAKLGSVCRRIYRIFSHAYFHHRQLFDDYEVSPWLGNWGRGIMLLLFVTPGKTWKNVILNAWKSGQLAGNLKHRKKNRIVWTFFQELLRKNPCKIVAFFILFHSRVAILILNRCKQCKISCNRDK